MNYRLSHRTLLRAIQFIYWCQIPNESLSTAYRVDRFDNEDPIEQLTKGVDVSNGADVNARNAGGFTSLLVACYCLRH